MESPRSRSPLKLKPLRLPGQSLEEAMGKLLWDELAPPLLFAIIFVGVAGFEWVAAIRRLPPQPWLFTSLAVVTSLYAARKVVKLQARVRRMALGRDGERIVAEELDKLRAAGAEIFHDIPAPGFNIDHVVLSCRGFYAIETKTWSTPRSGDARIRLRRRASLSAAADQIAIPSRRPKLLQNGFLDFWRNRPASDFPYAARCSFPGASSNE